jgi:uncharacterized protein
MVIPYQSLDVAVLDNIIEHFVLREGTDYGHQDYAIEQKVAAVRRQLERGEIVLTWDDELETCNLVTRQQLRQQQQARAAAAIS